MSKPSTRWINQWGVVKGCSTFALTGLAVLSLAGCDAESSDGLDVSLEKIEQASQIATNDATSIQELLAVDQVAARRDAFAAATRELENVKSSGTPGGQAFADALLARVELASVALETSQMREAVTKLLSELALLNTELSSYESLFSQVVALDPKVDGYLTRLDAAIMQEQGLSDQAKAQVAEYATKRQALKSQVNSLAAEAKQIAFERAGLDRQKMTASDRTAFLLDQQIFELSKQISSKQNVISSLLDQIRLIDHHSALAQHLADISDAAGVNFQELKAQAKQAAAADVAQRDQVHQDLVAQGETLAARVKASVLIYQQQIAEPIGELMARLEAVSPAASELGQVEVDALKLELMATQASALRALIGTLDVVVDRSETAHPADHFGQIADWYAQGLATAVQAAGANATKYKAELNGLLSEASQLRTATLETLKPYIGAEEPEAQDELVKAANRYRDLVQVLYLSIAPRNS